MVIEITVNGTQIRVEDHGQIMPLVTKRDQDIIALEAKVADMAAKFDQAVLAAAGMEDDLNASLVAVGKHSAAVLDLHKALEKTIEGMASKNYLSKKDIHDLWIGDIEARLDDLENEGE